MVKTIQEDGLKAGHSPEFILKSILDKLPEDIITAEPKIEVKKMKTPPRPTQQEKRKGIEWTEKMEKAPWLSDRYKKIPREFKELERTLRQLDKKEDAINELRRQVEEEIAEKFETSGLKEERDEIAKKIVSLMQESKELEDIIKMNQQYGLALREVFKEKQVLSPEDTKMLEMHQKEIAEIMRKANIVEDGLEKLEFMIFNLPEKYQSTSPIKSADELVDFVELLETTVKNIKELKNKQEELLEQVA